mgnify:FL=1
MIKALIISTFNNEKERNIERIEDALQKARISREDIISVNFAMTSYNVGNMVILYEKRENNGRIY